MNAEDYTASQVNIIAQITKGGFKIKTLSMIGRKLWVVAEKDRGNVFLDETIHGTIGVRGALKLKYEQFTTRQEVTEDWQLANRLK